MTKYENMVDPTSCFNRALMDEPIFVLLGRDPAAPVAIRAWVEERERLGKNKPQDRQILDALDVSSLMERQRLAKAKV